MSIISRGQGWATEPISSSTSHYESLVKLQTSPTVPQLHSLLMYICMLCICIHVVLFVARFDLSDRDKFFDSKTRSSIVSIGSLHYSVFPWCSLLFNNTLPLCDLLEKTTHFLKLHRICAAAVTHTHLPKPLLCVFIDWVMWLTSHYWMELLNHSGPWLPAEPHLISFLWRAVCFTLSYTLPVDTHSKHNFTRAILQVYNLSYTTEILRILCLWHQVYEVLKRTRCTRAKYSMGKILADGILYFTVYSYLVTLQYKNKCDSNSKS